MVSRIALSEMTFLWTWGTMPAMETTKDRWDGERMQSDVENRNP